MTNLYIARGNPQFTGRYVCYLPGLAVPTVLRLWIPEIGWCDFNNQKIAGEVAGWIGPLPVFPGNSVQALINETNSQTIVTLESAGRINNTDLDYDL